jgi:hypothetical protein
MEASSLPELFLLRHFDPQRYQGVVSKKASSNMLGARIILQISSL